MTDTQLVTVYAFRPLLAAEQSSRWMRYKAPREVIVERLEAVVIEGTAEAVPATELDESGCYCRIAIGWGESRPAAKSH